MIAVAPVITGYMKAPTVPETTPVLIMARENSPSWGMPSPTPREIRPPWPTSNVPIVSETNFPAIKTTATTIVGTMTSTASERSINIPMATKNRAANMSRTGLIIRSSCSA